MTVLRWMVRLKQYVHSELEGVCFSRDSENPVEVRPYNRAQKAGLSSCNGRVYAEPKRAAARVRALAVSASRLR